MPDFKVKQGHSLTASDPVRPGATIHKVAGDIISLTDDDAKALADAIESVPAAQPVAAAEPVEQPAA